MKRILVTLVALGLAGGLTACGKKEADAPPPAETAAPAASSASAATANASGNLSAMDMPAGAIVAKGTGTVTAVDPAAGTITLDHAPIPEANWPAMIMAFKAGPEVTKAVKVGDRVSFDLKLMGGGGEVTAIQKQ